MRTFDTTELALKALIAPLEKIGFSISEKIYSDPSTGHYLVVLKSDKLFVKLSKEKSESYLWLKSSVNSESSEWFEIGYVPRLLNTFFKSDKDWPKFFASNQEAVHYFVQEHDRILILLNSYSAGEIMKQIRQIDEDARSAALRSIGIDYKKR
ncbi:MAG TPA: hypothetical protein VFW05_07640 [Verrucomicrobiae bacterium]|nr:hypothetical protein [Verrucomicrobiae bacterium]